MAHPKRKISRTRRDKRRTHKKLGSVALSACQTTGEIHRRHNAYWLDGKMYYKGNVVIDNSVEEDEVAE